MNIQQKAAKKERPVKVLQFGEGNFLRAFIDYMLDIANEKNVFNGNVAVIKPRSLGGLDAFLEQDCLYTVILRGKENGEVLNKSRIITSVDRVLDFTDGFDVLLPFAKLDSLRFIVSNTTEAGIVLDENDNFDGLPKTYPGKLTKLLFERFNAFGGALDKGLIILPTELIDENGKKLKSCVLSLSDVWNLPQSFKDWVLNACVFCSTLVDRIVTGCPKNGTDELYSELGYEDKLIDIGEPFALWVIESEKDISDELPLDKIGLPVIFTNDHKPYKERKVRVLNGAHTSSVLIGYLAGIDIVRDLMNDELTGEFVRKAVMEEIVPTVNLPFDEVKQFADSVFERFENPYIDHQLLAISLNSVSKWRARVLPSVRDYYESNGKLPRLLTFSFAALLGFYSSNNLCDGKLLAKRNSGDEYAVSDDGSVLLFFAENVGRSNFVESVCKNTDFWGEDLTRFDGFATEVDYWYKKITADPKEALKEVLCR